MYTVYFCIFYYFVLYLNCPMLLDFFEILYRHTICTSHLIAR